MDIKPLKLFVNLLIIVPILQTQFEKFGLDQRDMAVGVQQHIQAIEYNSGLKSHYRSCYR